ncbi:MAG TPA: pyridoxamine 5'-phosphate oxidase [Jatrophihabitantaceae bacterium]|nr:pyridoxamine 5'-phosphate oxidase [Mycobacteriales bacterium]HZY77216.1 pyridoxamine 5'-phosphate oxidase [Jatrophihabitantaceae bacterium]
MPDPTALSRLRAGYQQAGLSRADLPAEPMVLWRQWLADAEAAGLVEANAMVVTTVEAGGEPSARTVLCKQADERGFVFFTNYDSRKGRAIATNPAVALLFPWHPLARQVIVNGRAERVSRAESEAYFATRPRGAQLSAAASEQSHPIADRAALEARVAELAATYDGRDVPCPAGWGGFVVRPETVEFWQGRADRLHDRLRYCVAASGWRVERLCP